MERVLFTSDDFPAGRDDPARFALWCDLFSARYGSKDITRAQDLPFNARFQFLSLPTVGLGLAQGPFEKIMHADSRTDAFALPINNNSSPITYISRDREVLVEPRMATLIALNEPGGGYRRPAPGNEWFVLAIQRKPLLDAVPNAENLLALPVRNDNEPLCYLRHYLSLLFNPNVEVLDERLMSHVDRTVFDLIVLVLGANRDAEALARMRGLRAARLRAILAQIERSFTDPAFSARTVAHALGLSPRYVYELIQESGVGFSERVLELRLQHAHSVLTNPRHAAARISDIALMSGFGEVSHFNRSFRRRFGMTPTAARES